MLAAAWSEYRSWAARARALQESSRRWTTAALASAAAAAIFGAAATHFSQNSNLGRSLSILAAATAALTPGVGRELLSIGGEAKWIRARATAEAIKSECYLAAARVG